MHFKHDARFGAALSIAPYFAPLIAVFFLILMRTAAAADLVRGEEVFAANCVSCHGVGGKPDPDSPLVKGLEVMPANFSDALFNSREPTSAWKTVVIEGGPALGFSAQMPAFGAALTEQDVDSVLAYIKTLGGEHDYPDGDLNLFLPVRTKKAFPEDEWVWKLRYSGLDGDNTWKNILEYEFRVGERFQGTLEMTHEVKGSQSDFGHFEPGFKYVLMHDRRAGYIFTLGGNVGVPMNRDANWEVLPFLAYGKLLSEEWTLQSSGRLKLDVENSDNSSAEFAGVVHWVHTQQARSVFPALELVAEVPFERGVGPDRKDAVQFSILPQARIGLNKRGNIALNTGLELPLNDTERYDWRAYVYFIWDFADGGLFEGW
ncbi:MAG: cytochrome c [Rhodocyclaceae bacterium]|nr:cytochrome c [Rhodocyclaceae bacterium]